MMVGTGELDKMIGLVLAIMVDTEDAIHRFLGDLPLRHIKIAGHGRQKLQKNFLLEM